MTALAACSGANDAPVVEYPPSADASTTDPPSVPDAGATPSTPDASVPTPVLGKKIASGSIFLRSVTSDGALVFDQDLDLMVWPDAAPTATTLVKDYADTDSMLVRGRFAAAWVGSDQGATMPVLWSKTTGVQTFAAKVNRSALYPKVDADDFAYLAPSTSLLNRDVWATKAGAGAGVKIVTGLDTGLAQSQCRSTITYAIVELIVAGCTDFTSTARVAAFALDGSASRTILDGSAPGVFVNRARTHAVVQTSTASSIRSLLAGGGAPAPLDGPVRVAGFSADDMKVVYIAGDGKLKRASAIVPTAPLTLAPSAVALHGYSGDGRFIVYATKSDANQNRYDILTLDANAPTTPARTLVAQKGTYVGMSKAGTQLVYLGEEPANAFGRPLSVVTLPAGAPQTVAVAAERVAFADDVVYWQEWVPAKKSNVLKAARLSSPGVVVVVDEGLDALTSQAVVVGKKLFVGSKLGLWEYPALTP